MSHEFHVGQRVVCIADSVDRIGDLGFPPFKRGEVYTVARLVWRDPYGLFLGFDERHEQHFGHHEGFRPLDERRLDIFRAHLSKAPKSTEPA